MCPKSLSIEPLSTAENRSCRCETSGHVGLDHEHDYDDDDNNGEMVFSVHFHIFSLSQTNSIVYLRNLQVDCYEVVQFAVEIHLNISSLMPELPVRKKLIYNIASDL